MPYPTLALAEEKSEAFRRHKVPFYWVMHDIKNDNTRGEVYDSVTQWAIMAVLYDSRTGKPVPMEENAFLSNAMITRRTNQLIEEYEKIHGTQNRV